MLHGHRVQRRARPFGSPHLPGPEPWTQGSASRTARTLGEAPVERLHEPRRGEIADPPPGHHRGLAWADVALERSTVHVRYQLVGSGAMAKRAPLKTAASHAPVPLPVFAVSRLGDCRAVQLEERMATGSSPEDGLVFVTEKGWAVHRNWLTKHFQKLLEQLR